MTEIRHLAAEAPLPDGHSVVVMRRFAEDGPRRVVTEMIVKNPDKSEETSLPTNEDGTAMSLEQAIAVATQRAGEEGLKRVWVVDRTATLRAREILEHKGDHSFGTDILADDDLEHGEHGSDMRDRSPDDGAPRRF